MLLLLLVAACAARRPAVPASGNAWFRAGREAVAEARVGVPPFRRARNVILFIGDGMGIATVTAARILDGQRHGASGEENLLSFERFPHTALAKTYTVDFQVADSAGTMTAMMSGVKTRSGVLGVDETVARGDVAAVAKGEVGTLLEQAEDRGLWTGIVTTTTVTHATPAGCYAHTPERDWENDAKLSPAARAAGFPDIARQLVELPHGDGVEVVLGGGRAHFQPVTEPDPEYPGQSGARTDGRDLVVEWRLRHPGGAYVWSRDQLAAVDPTRTHAVLGLFEPSHMRFEAERLADPAGEPSLSEMTATALDVLSGSSKGFFLMVEGGRIDHAHHAGNASGALGETIEFANAVQVALARTEARDTLIVVTADHSHAFTLAGYPRRGQPILGLVEGAAGEHAAAAGPARDLSGRPYTTLGYANGPGYTGATDAQPEGPKRFPHAPKRASGITRGRPDLTSVDTTAATYLQEATVPLASETHAGEDVPVYATGPGSALFHGVQEQSFIYHAMVDALGW